MTKCKVIALANQKGGTAKTTTTLNLGIGLARQGRKVLLVDADPQGDLTTALGWTNADSLPITLDTQMKKILQDEPFVYNEGILHHEEGVDIIPTNIELSGMEISLVNAMSREQTLKLYLADLKKDYDYILIDCMPSLGMLTINALAAADSVIVPVQAHYLPLKGMTQLMKTIGKVSDQVIRGGVKVQKRDLETKDTKAQGSATLKDTAFAIISLNENPVLVEGKLYKKNETVKTIQTGIDGIATTTADLLPYGKYKLEETKAPEGYLTDGAKAIEFSITENGKIVDLTDESHSIYNQIKRGDLEGVKIGAGTHKRLANVPFKITSKTTGESHIVVTDKNGQFSTASDWASHKKNTNAGTSSEDGIWFGSSEPDDSKGALLYDTYEIEELSCESNKGMKLIPAFEVVVSRNKVKIDLGTLTDEYEKEITIHTTATDKITGEKVIVAGKKVTIVDTVTLDGLEEGRKYQLKGWQMLKEENAELLIDGKRVESDYTFVADSEKMKVEVSYTFDASELGGQNLVTFEELYDLKNPEEPVKVAEHKDIDDEGQTVLITERKISIHTTATDKNGKKEVEAGKDLTIVDTVTLEGLEIGTNYKLSGWQMVKAENAKLLIDGKEVTNDYEFTADKENMEVQIEFTFDGSTIGGKQLVTFEELYDMTNPEEPKKVTEHKEINDEGQTVTIKEVPETPTPETPGTTTKTSNPPKTGDTANAILWIAILVLSAAGITGVRIWNKKKQVKRLGIEEKKEEEE